MRESPKKKRMTDASMEDNGGGTAETSSWIHEESTMRFGMDTMTHKTQ